MTAADGTPVDLDKLRSLSLVARRSGTRVREWRGEDGERHQATTDELGNTVTRHARGDRQDVEVNVPTLRVAGLTSGA